MERSMNRKLVLAALLAVGCHGATGELPDGSASTACALPPRQFWAWDLTVMPPADVQVTASCRAASDHAYVFVADEVWNASQMTQAQVDAIVDAFEHHTPADATRGIYDTDVGTFGAPPDVDNDPRVYLVYYPLGTFQGTSFDGYFRDIDEASDAHSNAVEMLHLNATGPHAPDSDYMLGVVIHELLHLINYKYDPMGEESWLHEAVAEAAMTLGGFQTDLPTARQYVKSTATTPLCAINDSDYGATFSWGSYMLDRWGASFVRDVVQDPAHGPQSVEAHLPAGATFRSAFGELMVADLIDQHAIADGRFGYTRIQLDALGAETAGILDGAMHTSDAVAWGARMLRFTPGGAGTLSLTLGSTALSTLIVYTIAFDPAHPEAATVALQASGSTSVTVAVAAGQVVDVVVAVAPAASVDDVASAPRSSFSYRASFAP
jgi:hypothetical protein